MYPCQFAPDDESTTCVCVIIHSFNYTDPICFVGAVLPVGGVLLAESFIEPLSGRMVRVRGASIRAAQVVPNAGGHQALLDSKVLDLMLHLENNKLHEYIYKEEA